MYMRHCQEENFRKIAGSGGAFRKHDRGATLQHYENNGVFRTDGPGKFCRAGKDHVHLLVMSQMMRVRTILAMMLVVRGK